MKKIKIYEYPKCSTCVKALKFLAGQRIAFEKFDIVASPPSKSEIKSMIGFYDGNFRKLFNTSGLVYKEMKLSRRVGEMSEGEAIELLSKNGKLIKRPFILSAQRGLVGFNEAAWKEAFC